MFESSWAYVTTMDYSINGYWWLFHYKPLVGIDGYWSLLMAILSMVISGYYIISYCWLLYVIFQLLKIILV
jgi:hypothetical protein